jgi:hypothetical protein
MAKDFPDLSKDNLNEAAQKLQVLCATCNQIKSFENKEHNRSRRVLERNI